MSVKYYVCYSVPSMSGKRIWMEFNFREKHKSEETLKFLLRSSIANQISGRMLGKRNFVLEESQVTIHSVDEVTKECQEQAKRIAREK